MSDNYDFSDIAPFDDSQFAEKMRQLVEEPGFEHAVRFVMPDVDYPEFVNRLLSIDDKSKFQRQIMYPFLKMLVDKTTDGITWSGIENLKSDVCYTFMSNHRDIVLDASFMNLCLIESGRNTSEIAIGSNLLIFDWITDLVKINKSFIVKRNVQRTKALDAARQLSAYIHHAINDKHESVWIAQREGRAKDSNDMTQESLVKMLGLGGEGTFVENLREINILPTSISYEYDPNDYLKAREFLMRRLNPEFKKSEHDDLLSMETGLLGRKGRIHFHFGGCIGGTLSSMPADTPRQDAVHAVCRSIDSTIHNGYKIYPINYIAFDSRHHTDHFADCYTPAQKQAFYDYIESQLDKVDIPNLSTLDRNFMRETMLGMYANPLRNQLAAQRGCEPADVKF